MPTIKALADQGARVVVIAHLGRPKGEPDPKYSLRPVAERLGELLGQDGRLRHRHGGGERHRDGGGARGRPGRGPRERPLQPRRDQQGRRGPRRRSPASWPAWPTRSSPTASAWCTASRPPCTTWRCGCRRDGWPGGRRDRGAAQADRRPRAALRRGARRLQGLRQARRDRQPARQGRQAADRRRHGVHLPQGPGPRGRQEPARGRPARHLPVLPRARATESGVEILLPTDIVVDTAFPSGDREPEPVVVPADQIPADSLGLDIGPESGEAFAAALADAQTVFWNGPMGVFETPAFAEGTRAVARGADQGAGPLRRRRRRLGRGRAPARLRRGRLRPHLDRRRRQPGVPRGQGAARDRRPRAIRTSRHDASHAPDGRQLEDEPQPPGGRRPGAEAGLDPQRQEARLRQGRGRGAAAVHRHPLGADARRRRPALDRLRRPGRVGARVRRLHRRDLRRDAGQARLHLRGGRPLRAARVPRRSPTSWSTPRPRPRWPPA